MARRLVVPLNVEWPARCACCMGWGDGAVVVSDLSGEDVAEVPYCARCAAHARPKAPAGFSRGWMIAALAAPSGCGLFVGVGLFAATMAGMTGAQSAIQEGTLGIIAAGWLLVAVLAVLAGWTAAAVVWLASYRPREDGRPWSPCCSCATQAVVWEGKAKTGHVFALSSDAYADLLEQAGGIKKD